MINEEQAIAKRYESLQPFLNELSRRAWAAAEANALGYGGIARVHRATGISRNTIVQGQRDLASPPSHVTGEEKSLRKSGGGRKKTGDTDPGLKEQLNALISPATRGDPESALRWTTKRLRTLAAELNERGHAVRHRLVAEFLHETG